MFFESMSLYFNLRTVCVKTAAQLGRKKRLLSLFVSFLNCRKSNKIQIHKFFLPQMCNTINPNFFGLFSLFDSFSEFRIVAVVIQKSRV